jgi:hypothetical protein
MSEKKPTESAIMHFGISKTHSRMAHQISAKSQGDESMQKSHMAIATYELADGLADLATGIRATYLLLDEVKRLLQSR